MYLNYLNVLSSISYKKRGKNYRFLTKTSTAPIKYGELKPVPELDFEPFFYI